MEWKKKKETKHKVALYAKDKRSQWYVENECSKHMIRDQKKNLSLKKEKKGNVTFVYDVSTKILGKGTIDDAPPKSLPW